MSKIFKNMLPYWKGLIIVVALLVVQAWCDLSLPAYTSDIIDVGIQNKGVEHVLPEAVTEDEFTLAQLFMADEEKESWENSYEKDGDVYRLTVTDKKQLDELDENIYLSDFHAAKGNSEQVVELDNRFHEILYNASDSKELKHVLLDFHHYVQRVRKITLADPKRSVQSNQEHRQLEEAVKKHDAGLAEKLANEHMMNTIHNMDNYGWDNLFQ